MPSSVKIFSKDQWRCSAPREGVTLMSVIFMVSLSLANIESATSDVHEGAYRVGISFVHDLQYRAVGLNPPPFRLDPLKPCLQCP